MSFDRMDFQQLLQKRNLEQLKQNAAELRRLAQADVPLDQLTHSKEWDFFLSLLQAEMETLDKVIAGLQEAYVHSPTFNGEELSQEKAKLMVLYAKRETLEQVIELPKQIIEKGEKARLALRDEPDT